jgi:hypothetical protein
MIECFVPIVFFYLLGTFNLDWRPTQNLSVIYFVLLFAYTQTTKSSHAYLCYMVGALYMASTFTLQDRNLLLPAHFFSVLLVMEFVPRFLPNQFSVSELFIFASINAFYVYFAFDSIERGDGSQAFLPGCNISNILCFTPWLVLNFTLFVQALLLLGGVTTSK